ncbi:hypothetical protein HB662_15380 [Roseomonas frigidaquae]|uniref:PepSY domain-containing protein n=1 Tax=Falsiroseomonas frigidaquae TaxID=487318 RepID=A0ABX1F1I5_9PROT|nr:PepSY domain-containing protein [Falsiroseomonas frigidaquae]NKE46168.1 hypothetical protein [Falsiroseomonas frigidaquae]
MTNFLNATALAATLVLGGYGVAAAQNSSTSQQGASSSSRVGTVEAPRMNEDQVRTILGARGYSDFEDMERDGDSFSIGSAERYGKDVEDLRVDARTGQVQDEERLSEDQAKRLLEDRGYSDVTDVSRDDDMITATATQNDREWQVRIDAETGTVTQQQASN